MHYVEVVAKANMLFGTALLPKHAGERIKNTSLAWKTGRM